MAFIECVASETATHQKQLHSILIWLLGHVLFETTATSKWYELFIYDYKCTREMTFTTIFNKLFPHTSKWSNLSSVLRSSRLSNRRFAASCSKWLWPKEAWNIALSDEPDDCNDRSDSCWEQDTPVRYSTPLISLISHKSTGAYLSGFLPFALRSRLARLFMCLIICLSISSSRKHVKAFTLFSILSPFRLVFLWCVCYYVQVFLMVKYMWKPKPDYFFP